MRDLRCICGEREQVYVRAGSWLQIVCGWCGIELHGIDLDRLDAAEREEVLREVA